MSRRRIILLGYLGLMAIALVLTRTLFPWWLAGELVWSAAPGPDRPLTVRVYRADAEAGVEALHLVAFWQAAHAWRWHRRQLSLPVDARALQYAWDGRRLRIAFAQPDGRLGSSTLVLEGP